VRGRAVRPGPRARPVRRATPVRDAAALPVPVELAEDQILRARYEDTPTRSLERRRETAPFELRAVERRIAEHRTRQRPAEEVRRTDSLEPGMRGPRVCRIGHDFPAPPATGSRPAPPLCRSDRSNHGCPICRCIAGLARLAR
jgi:hypothetical protein